MSALLVLTNLPDRAAAEKLADALIEQARRGLRQHPRALPLGLPLEGRRCSTTRSTRC